MGNSANKDGRCRREQGPNLLLILAATATLVAGAAVVTWAEAVQSREEEASQRGLEEDMHCRLPEVSQPQPPYEDTDHNLRCIICLSRKVNMLFKNCGHACMCEECIKVMAGICQSKEEVLACPMCRARGPLQKVYFYSS